MENDFEKLISLWKNYNNASKLLADAMGGTANEVGEFAEKLISTYYDAQQLPASNMSADLLTKDGKYIQVKSRKIEQLITTSLNVIRSWDFDILVVVIFSKYGDILKAIEIDSKTANSISKYNDHQNGYILTTSKKLLNNKNSIDITIALQKIMNHVNEENNMKSICKKEKCINKYIKKSDNIDIVNKISDNKTQQTIKIRGVDVCASRSGNDSKSYLLQTIANILPLLTEKEIEELQSDYFCKEKLKLNYPLLTTDNEKIFDGKHRRYYPEIVNKKYYVCNHWYQRNYEKWRLYLLSLTHQSDNI